MAGLNDAGVTRHVALTGPNDNEMAAPKAGRPRFDPVPNQGPASDNVDRMAIFVLETNRGSSNQRSADDLAIDAHAEGDRSHRDPRLIVLHGLSRLFDPESRTSPPCPTTAQMRRHRCPMDAVPLSQLVDCRPLR